MNRVKEVLAESVLIPYTSSKPPSFAVEGLGSFDGQVLFADVKGGRDLVVEIGNIVRSVFVEHGFPNADEYEVVPHATLMKLFQARQLKGLGIRRLKSDW